MANALSHPRVDVAHFWTTRWRFGGFAPTNNPGSVADALNVRFSSHDLCKTYWKQLSCP